MTCANCGHAHQRLVLIGRTSPRSRAVSESEWGTDPDWSIPSVLDGLDEVMDLVE